MHGMINRGLQSFVQLIYSQKKWDQVTAEMGQVALNYEALLYYDDLETEDLIDAICLSINRTRAEMLEDFGTFLVSELSSPTVRRLLRLGGTTYSEFMYSLEEVEERVRLALPDLDLPCVEVVSADGVSFTLTSQFNKLCYGEVLLGILRAMSDTYGALVTVDLESSVIDNIAIDTYRVVIAQDSWGHNTTLQVAE